MNEHSRPNPDPTLDETAFPAAGTLEDKARFLLGYAILAPSTQNTQPWRFALRGPTVDLYADPARWLHVADRDRRELHLSVGCALENLLIAAEHFGLGHWTELAPDRWQPDLLATVRLEAGGEPAPFRPPELFDAIARRATVRGAYRPDSVPDDLLARLRGCGHEDGIRLLLTGDPEARAWVESLVEGADERQLADPAWQEEVKWLRASGVLGESPSVFRCDARTFATAPVFGLLVTLEDDPASRVRTGQVFERLHLTATSLGLDLQPVSQLLELGAPREALADVLGIGAAYPQQPFRLGFGAASREGRAPRRPLEEVLLDPRSPLRDGSPA